MIHYNQAFIIYELLPYKFGIKRLTVIVVTALTHEIQVCNSLEVLWMVSTTKQLIFNCPYMEYLTHQCKLKLDISLFG